MSYPPPGNPFMPRPGMPRGVNQNQFQQFGGMQPGMAMNMQMGLLPQPPISKMQMHPGMRPNMQRPPMAGHRFQQQQQQQQQQQPQQQQQQQQQQDDSTPGGDPEANGDKPKTTVFVGNISDRAPDALIRSMLSKCGSFSSWKRVQGASGKLQAFGFCEYVAPEASLRAIRLLHDLELGDKKLLVKVDAKTRVLLDEYLADKGQSSEDLDDETQGEDSNVKGQVDRLIIDYKHALTKPQDESSQSQQQQQSRRDTDQRDSKEPKKTSKKENIQDLNNIEEDKRHIISREIDRFRDTYKAAEDREKERLAKEQRQKDRESRRDKDKDRVRDKSRDKSRERDKERERERDKERERERERRDRDRRDALKEKEREEKRDRDRRQERDREREKERDREKERERERDRGRSRERESRGDRDRSDRDREHDRDRFDEEEEFERRKLERKLREKEEAYQQRLKAREARERKRSREYEKLREKQDMERSEMEREAKRLREFLEDYDDERDDPKYYMGSALERRRKEREKEIDGDNRDRRREREELEEIKRKLLEEGHDNVEEEMEKLEQEREKHRLPQLALIPIKEDKPKLEPTMKPLDGVEEAHQEPIVQQAAAIRQGPRTPESSSDGSPEPLSMNSAEEGESQKEQHKPRISFGGLKLVGANDPQLSAAAKRKKLSIVEAFNQDEDPTDLDKKRRKLVPIDYSEEEMKAVGQSQAIASAAEEKRKTIKNLIEKIPTAKEELFRYKVDWPVVDESLMERRIKPWINKKIVEYIGEEEATLTEFICSKLLAHSSAESILSDITMVLDEEAEVFVVKMWRLLIYEVEAKKHGLVK
ncbi:RNA-binding protein 25-like isoform X2 [Asterias rubens]|uniref:RNA-binding protein 25-like isoform X2 n=1 Tax=Asterias rubens TaxID=7604 RepID=UPI0014555E51|nr:RNA-binding protein 25-like isoform X2 [Asterias rubens]